MHPVAGQPDEAMAKSQTAIQKVHPSVLPAPCCAQPTSAWAAPSLQLHPPSPARGLSSLNRGIR